MEPLLGPPWNFWQANRRLNGCWVFKECISSENKVSLKPPCVFYPLIVSPLLISLISLSIGEEFPKGLPFPSYFPSFSLFLSPLVSPSISLLTLHFPLKSPLNSSPTPCFPFFPLSSSIVTFPGPQITLKWAKKPSSDLIIGLSPLPQSPFQTTSPHVPRCRDQALMSRALIAIRRSAGVLFLCKYQKSRRDLF